MAVPRAPPDVRKTGLCKAFRTGLWVASLGCLGAVLRRFSGQGGGGDAGSWRALAAFDAGHRGGPPRAVGRPGPLASRGLRARTVRRAQELKEETVKAEVAVAEATETWGVPKEEEEEPALCLEELNAEQLAAVTAPDGVQLVVAGAGTGKTKTLAHRVAWLIMEKHVPPHQILLLTFTKAAAREMIGRVASLVGDAGFHVQSGTFHSFAHNVLRRNCAVAGLRSQWTMLNDDDQQLLIKMILQERDYNLTVSPKDIRRSFGKHVATEKSFDQIQANFSEFPLVEDVFNEYQHRKRLTCTMDFDDLLARLEELLTASPEVRQQVANQYRYVLIDEYQDTDRRQARIAEVLFSKHGNLMVVGDPGQSIYAFRGADVKNIVDFQESYPEAQVIKLGRNYRSVQPILDVANAIIRTGDGWGFDNTLSSHLPGGNKPLILQATGCSPRDLVTGCGGVAAYVKKLLEKPEEEIGTIGLLYRKNRAGDVMESMLQYEGVKSDRLGGRRFLERRHVKDMVALWRLIVNPLDAAAWMRVLPWFDGLGPKTADEIFGRISRGQAESLADVAAEYEGQRFEKELVDLQEFKDIIERDLAENPVDLVAVVDKSITWYTSYGQDLYVDWEERLDSMGVLLSLAEKADSLESLLATLALDEPDPNGPRNRVTLSTIHSAKGLEWDTVVIIYVMQGHMPLPRSEVEAVPGSKVQPLSTMGESGSVVFEVLHVDGDEILIDNGGFQQWVPKREFSVVVSEGPAKEALEEERRLFYVAVTRAKKNLMLMTHRQKNSQSAFMRAIDSKDLFRKTPLKPGKQTKYVLIHKDKFLPAAAQSVTEDTENIEQEPGPPQDDDDQSDQSTEVLEQKLFGIPLDS